MAKVLKVINAFGESYLSGVRVGEASNPGPVNKESDNELTLEDMDVYFWDYEPTLEDMDFYIAD